MIRDTFGTIALAGLLAVPVAGCGEDDLIAPITIVDIQLSNSTCGGLSVGGTCQLTAVAIGSDGEPMEDPRLRWLSENIVIATVSGSGVVTGINPGTATIRVETTSGTISDKTTVSVRGDDSPPDNGPAP